MTQKFRLPLWLAVALSLPTAAAAAPLSPNTGDTCAARFDTAKAADALPAGLTLPQYAKAHCLAANPLKPALTPSFAVPLQTPAEGLALKAPVADWTKIPVAKADKNGKPFTPAQIAAHQRAKQCGALWRQESVVKTLPATMTWPRYWSQCNAKLKLSQ